MICFGHFFKPTCEENDLRNIPLSRPGCFQCKWIHTQVGANWVTLLKNERELPWKVLRALVYSQFLSKQFNTEGGRQSGACWRVFLSRDRSKYDDSFSSPQIIFFLNIFSIFHLAKLSFLFVSIQTDVDSALSQVNHCYRCCCCCQLGGGKTMTNQSDPGHFVQTVEAQQPSKAIKKNKV